MYLWSWAHLKCIPWNHGNFNSVAMVKHLNACLEWFPPLILTDTLIEVNLWKWSCNRASINMLGTHLIKQLSPKSTTKAINVKISTKNKQHLRYAFIKLSSIVVLPPRGLTCCLGSAHLCVLKMISDRMFCSLFLEP